MLSCGGIGHDGARAIGATIWPGQAIMAGTMKAPMAKVPPGVQQVWVEGGVIEGEKEKAA